MPKLILPFQLKALYCSTSRTISKPSADFSKVAYFDRAKETVVNTDSPYISENLVTQPFRRDGLVLEKGIHLHFILPQILRSTIELPKINGENTFQHDFPAIPNRWLVIKNDQEHKKIQQQYLIETDYLYPEYNEYNNKITVPIPWKVFEEKKLNVPFRYMGRQYNLEDEFREEGDYWYDLLDTPLTATGYGDISFTGFFPNCKEVLTFHDSEPKDGDTYKIWGWYDFGENTQAIVDAIYAFQINGKSPPEQEQSFKENWGLTFIPHTNEDTYFQTDQNDLLVYGEIAIPSLEKYKPNHEEKSYQLAIGNSATEAIAALAANNANNYLLEDFLQAIGFNSIKGTLVDIGARFIAERHRKSFSPIESGFQYFLEDEISVLEERAAIQKAVDKVLREPAVVVLYENICQGLLNLNQLQATYDQHVKIIQSKQQQLFADWYKYMLSVHPPLLQDDQYPRGDDILQFLFNISIQDLQKIIDQTGILDIPIEARPDLLYKGGTESLAAQIQESYDLILDKVHQLQVLVNEQIDINTRELFQGEIALSKLYEQLARKPNDKAIKTKIFEIEKNIRPLALFNVLLSKVLNKSGKKHVGLKENIINYSIFTKSSQRYYEPNEPVLLIASEKSFDTENLLNPRDSQQLAYSLQDKNDWEKLDERFSRVFPVNPDGIAWKEILEINNPNEYNAEWLLLDWGVGYLPIDDPLEKNDYDLGFIYKNFDIRQDTPDFTPITTGGRTINFSNQLRQYFGTTILTDTVSHKFLKQLMDYNTLHPNLQNGSLFKNAIDFLEQQEILTQSIGGFNQALLMRKQTMQLEVGDPIAFNDYKPIIQTLSNYIGNERKSAPEPSHFFNPIRAGGMMIQQLQMVDTFGCSLNLYDYDKDSSQEIVRANTLRFPINTLFPDKVANLKDKMAYLAPRFSQAARLDLHWVSAEDGSSENEAKIYVPNPICGWLSPNFLENSITFFSQAGKELGGIRLDDDGTIALIPIIGESVFSWNAIQNEHLRNVINFYYQMNGVPNNEGNQFQKFLNDLKDSLVYIEPETYAQHTQLSMLMGRPLAIVRASIHLQIMGDYAINQDWDVFKNVLYRGIDQHQRPTYDFEKVRIPLRIGDYDQLNDGVVGYWYRSILEEEDFAFQVPSEQNPDTVNLNDTLYMPLAKKIADPILKEEVKDKSDLERGRGSFVIDQSLSEKPQVITMLFDPRGNLNISSGLQPVKNISIPANYFESILEEIKVHFLVSPILTPFQKLQVPLPSIANHQWNWVYFEKGKEINARKRNNLTTRPSISKSRLERYYLNGLEKINLDLWGVLFQQGWLIPIDNNKTVGRLDIMLDARLPPPYDSYKDKIADILRKEAKGDLVEKTDFYDEYDEEIGQPKREVWQELIDKKWLEKIPDNALRAWINFDINSREDLLVYFNEDAINTILNNYFYSLSPIIDEPQFEQNSIKEGWLKLDTT